MVGHWSERAFNGGLDPWGSNWGTPILPLISVKTLDPSMGVWGKIGANMGRPKFSRPNPPRIQSPIRIPLSVKDLADLESEILDQAQQTQTNSELPPTTKSNRAGPPSEMRSFCMSLLQRALLSEHSRRASKQNVRLSDCVFQTVSFRAVYPHRQNIKKMKCMNKCCL